MSEVTTRGALSAVAGQLRSEGGLLADALLDEQQFQIGADDPALGLLAASGPRSNRREAEIASVVEAVYEGFLLHDGRSRILDAGDRDLAILAGDRLYALGLATLAELGDLPSVAELADVIAISAAARASGDEQLAAAIWQAGASAIGWGTTADYQQAKVTAVADHQRGAAELLAAARQLREALAPGR